jgi:hypothetical protein
MQAHLGPQRSGKWPAAFVAGTARVRLKTIAAGRSRRNGFVSGPCGLVMAGWSTLPPRSQRHPRAVFVLVWHRDCSREGRERPRKQDQQQQSGGQALHIKNRKGKFPRGESPTRFVARPLSGSAASSSIGQFCRLHNPQDGGLVYGTLVIGEGRGRPRSMVRRFVSIAGFDCSTGRVRKRILHRFRSGSCASNGSDEVETPSSGVVAS